MSFLDDVVGRGERVRRQERQHPAGIARRLALRVLQVVGLMWLHNLANASAITELFAWPPLRELGLEPWLTPLPSYFQSLCSLLVLAVVAWAIVDGLRWHGRLYALTDERVVVVHGAFIRVALEIPLEKIQELAIAQGPLGRQLRYGDVLIRTGAAGEARVLSDVSDAIGFKNALEKLRRGGREVAATATPAATRAVASRLS